MELVLHKNGLMFFYLLVLLLYCFACTEGLDRRDFPAGFVFGSGSSAYQYEGAAYQHGKGTSIWDTFTRMHPDKIIDNSTGDVAEDFYYRFKEDVALMKEVGLDSFRFSISWSRVLPKGKLSGGINPEGVRYYNELIDELLCNDIKPFITLFHWDLPQALEDEYGGFLSTKIVNEYHDYADFCFKQFGDRVKHWATFNEPNTFSSEGYATGNTAPGRCSTYEGNCAAGNSATEPYVVAHNILLSHATAVKLYREKYQASQMGDIGITVSTFWMVPKYQTDASTKAAARALDFAFGWFVNPVTCGDYPESMRALVGNRLPNFTEAESNMLKGSFNFLGVNYYTARYADDSTSSSCVNLIYTTDSHVNLTTEKDGIPIGEPTSTSWLYIYPRGIQELTLYVKRNFCNPPIFITENGFIDVNNSSLRIEDFLSDSSRLKYIRLHLSSLLNAIKDGVDVKGYYIWSFLDDFEWELGYTLRLGINYVDFKNGLRRYMKHSALWFKDFLQQENMITRPKMLSFQ
ncbi:beta-glucosidase 17-like isoform X1 [Juglans microcarpa x Juglans regia]|uniref:beta-glucosidase 17-like isoform X1 n=2 Tax=Juglans microcarpa x Juglans regia TaxID=2249226 RepID=UPI001B7D9C5C|nr:beta-glucosidase 17-like isoform X1 [Juglans microcarpa x Juglans regia]